MISIISNPCFAYTEKQIQEQEGAAYVKGFEYANTTFLHKYCANYYVPYEYTNLFKERFKKTILNADNIIDTLPNGKEFVKNHLNYLYYNQAYNQAENEILKLSKINGMTKLQFCQIYDTYKEGIINEKIELFKLHMNHMFKD